MAEFLIYNKTHWTKELSAEDVANWTTHEGLKFAAVHEEGDIVEVREDGGFDTVDPEAYRVVKKPGLSFEKYECLMEPVMHQFPSINDKTYLQYRRRGMIDGSDKPVDKLGKL